MLADQLFGVVVEAGQSELLGVGVVLLLDAEVLGVLEGIESRAGGAVIGEGMGDESALVVGEVDDLDLVGGDIKQDGLLLVEHDELIDGVLILLLP